MVNLSVNGRRILDYMAERTEPKLLRGEIEYVDTDKARASSMPNHPNQEAERCGHQRAYRGLECDKRGQGDHSVFGNDQDHDLISWNGHTFQPEIDQRKVEEMFGLSVRLPILSRCIVPRPKHEMVPAQSVNVFLHRLLGKMLTANTTTYHDSPSLHS